MTRDKGALAKDDRLDALAMAVATKDLACGLWQSTARRLTPMQVPEECCDRVHSASACALNKNPAAFAEGFSHFNNLIVDW